MQVQIDFSIVPLGVGVSISEYVAECERIFDRAGLSYQLHANGTNIEGEWDAVFAAVKACHEMIHAKGAPRIHATMRINTRTDREQSLDDKIASVKRHL